MIEGIEFLGAEDAVTDEQAEMLLETAFALGIPAYIVEIERNGIVYSVAMPLWGSGALLIQ